MVEMEHPWETSFTLHTTIIDDDGLFRLYYTCYNQMAGDALSEGQQNPFSYYLCYAESEDGVSWTKPTVGTVDWRGTTENNIVYGTNRALGRPVPTATVFKDPGAPPAERYKIIHRGRRSDGARCVYGATSPDGIDWHGIEEPVIPEYFSDTQIVARYDEDRGVYCGYFRGWTTHSSGMAHGRRTIAYAETEDFRRWPIPETIVTTAVHDHPGADIYTNGYAVWPDADAHLMFPAFFEREIDITQIQLLTSRDGVQWERHTREPVLGGGDPGTSGAPRRDWTAGFFAGAGVVSTRSDESSIAVIPCVRHGTTTSTRGPRTCSSRSTPARPARSPATRARSRWRPGARTASYTSRPPRTATSRRPRSSSRERASGSTAGPGTAAASASRSPTRPTSRTPSPSPSPAGPSPTATRSPSAASTRP